jgi:hypothetical protein
MLCALKGDGSMRKLVVLLSLFGIGLPTFAATPVSVEQLEQRLATEHGKRDGEVARQLSDLELTQRFDTVKLSRWLGQSPGPKARLALIVLADMSAFLDLPAAEIPVGAAPDLTAQRRTMALTMDYITKTIHQLPNLFATRVTTSFQDTLWRHEIVQPDLVRHQPIHIVGRYSANVLYRNGGEEVRADTSRTVKTPPGLMTSGEFGLLGTVLADAARNKLYWSHWEQDGAGTAAVYRYEVPAEKSHYRVGSSWVQKADGDRVVFQKFTGYEGEVAVDPSNGTILRLILRADLKPTDPLVKANIVVEYGPIVIGGKTYICPVRSVALSVGSGLEISSESTAKGGPRLLQTSLNDVSYEQYHLFHADARILNGYNLDSTGTPAPR